MGRAREPASPAGIRRRRRIYSDVSRLAGPTGPAAHSAAVFAVTEALAGGADAVHAESNGGAGRGVVGIATAEGVGDTVGVYGQLSSLNGIGVSGYSTNPDGASAGVRGISLGAFGVDGAGQTAGVRGTASGPAGIGVYGTRGTSRCPGLHSDDRRRRRRRLELLLDRSEHGCPRSYR